MNDVKKIEEVLQSEGILVSTTVGVSMYPMLRNRKDTIVVKPCEGRLKKYDVALYKSGGSYVLHRVLEVRSDSYVIRGDNCDRKEYGITDSQILGVLTSFYRGDKLVDMNGWKYKTYTRVCCALFLVLWCCRFVKRVTKKVCRIVARGERKK